MSQAGARRYRRKLARRGARSILSELRRVRHREMMTIRSLPFESLLPDPFDAKAARRMLELENTALAWKYINWLGYRAAQCGGQSDTTPSKSNARTGWTAFLVGGWSTWIDFMPNPLNKPKAKRKFNLAPKAKIAKFVPKYHRVRLDTVGLGGILVAQVQEIVCTGRRCLHCIHKGLHKNCTCH